LAQDPDVPGAMPGPRSSVAFGESDGEDDIPNKRESSTTIPNLEEGETRLTKKAGRFKIASTRTNRDLGGVLDEELTTQPKEITQELPDVYPIEHRFDDAMDEMEVMRQRVAFLERKVEMVSDQQEKVETEVIDVISACKMVLGGILTEGDFQQRTEDVAKVREGTEKMHSALKMSQSVRDREMKVVFFGPDTVLRGGLVEIFGVGSDVKPKAQLDGLSLTHHRRKGLQFTFWNVLGDFAAVPNAIAHNINAASSTK